MSEYGRMKHGDIARTSIALIVSEGARNQRHAERFVSNLPDTATLTVHANWHVRRRVRTIANSRAVACSWAESPEAAIRNAQIAILIGDSPFSPRDISILEEQGVVVEHRDLEAGRPGRPGRRRNGTA